VWEGGREGEISRERERELRALKASSDEAGFKERTLQHELWGVTRTVGLAPRGATCSKGLDCDGELYMAVRPFLACLGQGALLVLGGKSPAHSRTAY
jgi:hypothetical protein